MSNQSFAYDDAKNDTVKKFTDEIGTYLSWQEANYNNLTNDLQGIKWYGSYVYSLLRNQTENAMNFRMQNIMYGMARSYYDDPKNKYIGNKSLLNSALISGDFLARNHNDTGNNMWADYANRGFICYKYAQTLDYLSNKSILIDNTITFNFGINNPFSAQDSNCFSSYSGIDDVCWIGGVDRWSENKEIDGVTYNDVLDQTSAYIYVQINNNPNPYDILDEGTLDTNITISLRYNDTYSNSNHLRIRLKEAGTSSFKPPFIGSEAIGGTNDNQWHEVNISWSLNASDTTGYAHRIEINLLTNGAVGGNVSIDWVKVHSNRKTQWLDSLNDTYSTVPVGAKPQVSNQELGRAICEWNIYKINNDQTHYNNFNETIYRVLSTSTIVPNTYLNSTRDGLPTEWNEDIKDGLGCNSGATLDINKRCYLSNWTGYDSNYNYLSLYFLGSLYNDSRLSLEHKTLIENNANKSIDTLSDLIIPNKWFYKEFAFSSRAINNKNNLNDLDTFNIYYPFAFYNYNYKFNRWIYKINQSMNNNSYSKHSDIFEGGGVSDWWDLYDIWREPNTNSETTKLLPIENTTIRYLHNYSTLGLVTVKNYNRIHYISFHGSTPAGGIISDSYNINEDKHYFSGKTQSLHNSGNEYGLGLLIIDTNCSNTWDINSEITIISNVYPYSIQFKGLLRYANQTSCGVSYNTTYTFYEDAINIIQNTNDSVELELWTISIENIGTDTIPIDSLNKLNNIYFFSKSVQLNYTDTIEEASFGTVDKLNSTGTLFNYSVIYDYNKVNLNLETNKASIIDYNTDSINTWVSSDIVTGSYKRLNLIGDGYFESNNLRTKNSFHLKTGQSHHITGTFHVGG